MEKTRKDKKEQKKAIKKKKIVLGRNSLVPRAVGGGILKSQNNLTAIRLTPRRLCQSIDLPNSYVHPNRCLDFCGV